MKTIVGITLGLVCAQQLMGEEIHSKVIHQDTYIGAGYEYFHDIGNSGAKAHGVFGAGSYDYHNVLFGVSGGYAWGDEDVDFWRAGGSLAYVVRLMENHVNIVPRVGIFYNEVLFNGNSDNVTTINPGITLSYAFNNQLSINGGYTYGHDIDFDNEGDQHTFSAGSRLAIAENVGLDVRADFIEGFGFSVISAMLQFHF